MRRGPGGPSGPGLSESTRRLDAGTTLALLLAIGLLVRIFIAGVLLPQSGFAIDVDDFTAWGQRLASVGPANFYEPGYFSDYPPGYLYVLWLLGAIGGVVGPLVGQDATRGFVKVPGILADLGGAAVLFLICRTWGGELLARTPARRLRLDGEGLGLLAASVYLLNPGTIFNSAVWGQVDSVGTLVLLLTIYALGRGRTELAALGAVVAMLVKFQFAFLIPIVAIVGLKRHLFGRSSDAEHDGQRRPVRVLTSLAVGVVTLAVLILPFDMTLYVPLDGGDPRGLLGLLPEADPERSLIGKLGQAAGTYPGLSINAFNLWRNPVTGLGDTLQWGDDTAGGLTLGGELLMTWQQVGTLLFAAAALLALVQVGRRDDMRGVLVASLLIAVAFFVLPTRVHERYLFPAIALSAPLLLAGRSWPWIAGGISLSFFANVYWVYTEDWSFAGRLMNPGLGGQPMRQDPVLEATLFTDAGIWILSAMVVAVLAAVTWQSLRLALRPAAAAEAAAVGPPPRGRATLGRPAGGDEDRGAGVGWLTPNAADAYLHEPTGRLDRRDALLLLALVVFALAFRLWRLDVPRGQHFDEVYHARSAAEFLSAWRNDWDRDVYEWTHPMLAKYLIAGGIVVADPNRVVGQRPLDGPSSALAVATRREAAGRERSVAFTLDGSSTIVAWDAESGDEVARWEAGGPVGTLAYDPGALRLLVGRADEGTVESYELASMLASPDGRAPPELSPIDTDLEAVSQIVVGEGAGAPIVLRGPDGVAVIDRASGEVLGTAPGSFGGVAVVQAVEDDPASIAVTDTGDGVVRYLDATSAEPRTAGEGEPLVVQVDAPLVGPQLAIGGGDDQRLFVLTGPLAATDEHPATTGGIAAIDADGSDTRCGGAPCVIDLVPLPGAPSHIGWQREAELVYVAGISPSDGPQAWTLEPHVERRGESSVGLAAFDATSLPGTPVAMAFDVATSSQADDHGRLLLSTVSEDGEAAVVAVDAGSSAFAWRLAGVAFGAALVGLVYLLAATMFSRRRIAVLAAAFVAIDGMSYVMSRISMNDIFVATFIVAAYALFWQVWSGRWSRSAWWALPAVGVLIGLAAATKWVGFYALFGLLVLALARSALGRLVLVALAAVATVVAGIGAPWPFGVAMLGVLAVALAITYARPIRIELRDLVAILATALVLVIVALPFVLAFGSVGSRNPNGAVEYAFGLLARGAEAGWPAWIMIGVATVLILWRALLTLSDPETDARWYRPTQMGGFAWSWIGACLVIVPMVVYGLSYLPYIAMDHAWAIPDTGPGYGWSVEELHAQMFAYHFNLQAGHDSASPWWSWPLALKPTWFYDGSFDGSRIAVIYNGGNPILFWAGIPALVACGFLAWRRRSAALVLIVAAFAFQYVPWIRIERATFAYHYLTAVTFAMIAVAYVVDELLRRPVWRSLAVGYLALVAGVGLLIFPLGAALPMPDWYVNAARALPPWNFGFQFPDPPQGDRAELVSVDGAKLVAAGVVALLATSWSLYGRALLDRLPRRPSERLATTAT